MQRICRALAIVSALSMSAVSSYAATLTAENWAEEAPAVWASQQLFSQTAAFRGAGPVTHAAQQPTGALSGVVVFCSAGHGWTADTTTNGSEWILQRPGDLWDMNEDYGNLDQLNYFVQYAYNAGATVVPFRPVGYQSAEIVLDNDDVGVTYSGTWDVNTSSSKYYGHNGGARYRFASAAPVETATARFTPNIATTDFYPIYCFTIAGTNRTLQTYRIKHSGGISSVVIDHRQVGNGWIWLGEFHLAAGDENYVEISNASSEAGVVVADAIRWGNGMGDVWRPEPNSISGYPRMDECARYWAHSTLGDNATGFTASEIWDSSGTDQEDNVSTASRWAREMNQVPAGGVLVDRWKRVYVEFHTNAFNGNSRGSVGLYHSTTPTENQQSYAAILCDELDSDMFTLDADFEHTWGDYALSTLGGNYGALGTAGNSNEFDSTILEVAFHDNPLDTDLLRDARVRAAVARSSVKGIIRFLSSLPNSAVPLAFPPDKPRNVRVRDAGAGNVTLTWAAPLSGAAIGDAATGYVVYVSTNGYGFTLAETLGNVMTTTLGGLPVGETRYYRIAATNAGGESTPSETLAVRRPANGQANALIVNGFDRLRRQQNPAPVFTQPSGYAGDNPERPIWRQINSFDYVVQFAEALEATTIGFDSCVNDVIDAGQPVLNNYAMVLWNLGTESVEDKTLSNAERSALTAYLEAGGAMFISGSDLAYDLINQGAGATFARETFMIDFVANDVGTYGVEAAGGILADVGTFDFDPDHGAPYIVYEPDELSVRPGGEAVLTYAGGGVAGVQYDALAYRVVTFGFPFEAITSKASQAAIMNRVIPWLEATVGPLAFDWDGDGDIDDRDLRVFEFCNKGPTIIYAPGNTCIPMDGDGDFDVDLKDFFLLQQVYTTQF